MNAKMKMLSSRPEASVSSGVRIVTIIVSTKNIYKYTLLMVFVTAIISGCSFTKIGSDLGQGLSTKTDAVGKNLIAGIRDELTDSASQKKISLFLDSLISSVAASAGDDVSKLTDSVFNKKILIWADSLVQTLTGNTLQLNVKEIQASLVGKTKEDVKEMLNSFRELLNGALSDSTKEKIGKIRDELLGAKTDSALSRIVDNAMTTIAARYKSDLAPELKKDVSFITKNATTLLLALVGIAAAIIFFVWWNKRKYLKMVTVLTKHINDIPDKQVYDLVTSKIKDEAITTGVEPHLRKVLDKNGLLGKDAWEKRHAALQNVQTK